MRDSLHVRRLWSKGRARLKRMGSTFFGWITRVHSIAPPSIGCAGRLPPPTKTRAVSLGLVAWVHPTLINHALTRKSFKTCHFHMHIHIPHNKPPKQLDELRGPTRTLAQQHRGSQLRRQHCTSLSSKLGSSHNVCSKAKSRLWLKHPRQEKRRTPSLFSSTIS